MKKRVNVNIGIIGGSFCCPNFGVGALTISQCNILEQIAVVLGMELDIVCYESIIQNDYLQKFEHLNISLDTSTLNICIMRKKLERHDLIIDIYGGDSFSDIYSIKGFILGAFQRILSMKTGTKYLLAPQTIGPFKNGFSLFMAKILMKRAKHIFCRDKLSLEAIPSKYIERTTCVSDMAFRLPYVINSQNKKVGLNVSGLLWNSDLLGEKKEAYKKCVREIIQYCIDHDISLTLIPHVNDIENSIDGDYVVSEKLLREYKGKIFLAPRFKNPVEAKSYISKFKLFIGSRMHATVAAISIGIPTLVIAYSRKFIGLYKKLGYSYVIERESIDYKRVIKEFDNMWTNCDIVKNDVTAVKERAQILLKKYDDYLVDLLEMIYHE